MSCFRFLTHELVLGSRLAGGRMAFAEPGVQPHYGPSCAFVIEHAHVHLRIDPGARVYEGSTAFRVRTLPTFAGRFAFDLDGVEVSAVEDAAGAALTFRVEERQIVVTAPAGVGTIVIRYAGGEPPAGLYFTGPTEGEPDRDVSAWTQCQDEDAHFFMPCLDHPRFKHPWTIELEGPVGFTLLSNGELVEQGEREGGAFAVWKQADPMPAYLFTAVVAKLDVTDHSTPELPIRYLVPAGHQADVHAAFGRTPEMVSVFSEITGVAYPWPRYDQVVVHDFIFGGMENTAATTMIELLLVDERVGPHWPADGLVCHELAHQWFGDLVTCQDWSQGWLNESFATFMETVWWDHAQPVDEATWYAWQQARNYLGEDAGRYRRPIASYLFREPIDLFDRHLYEKGSVVLRTLRGELGSEAFWAGVTHYLERHAHGTVHGREFQKAMEDATGANLDRFIHQWILSPGHPSLEVSMSTDEGLLLVAVTQTQEGDDTPAAYQLQLHLEIIGEDGHTTAVTLPVRERERTFAVPVDGAVSHVRVDPGFQVLAEIALEAPVSWLSALALDPCPVLAARAVAALSKKNTPAAIAGVRTALSEHAFWGVRAEAAKKLGARGGDDGRGWLLAAFATETETRVRTALADALGNWRNEDVATALMGALEDGADTACWHELGAILVALGKTRDPRAAPVIERWLDRDSWGDLLRQKAAAGLAHTHKPDVLDALVAQTRSSSDRAASGAASALGVLGDTVESARRTARERLEELLIEGGFRTKLAASAALGVLKDPASLGALGRVHASAPDGRIRRMAWEAMVRVREGRTTEAGLSALREQLDGLKAKHEGLRSRLDKLERPAE